MKKRQRNKWLFSRFGGVGDGLALTSVCEAVKFKDPNAIVHYAIREGQEGLYRDNPYIDKVLTIKRMPPSGIDCVKMKGVWGSLDVIKSGYYRAIDMKNSVENNSMYPNLPYGFWVRTMNSNYQHWVDLSIGWAGIDPTEIPDEIKRPKIYLKDSEIDHAMDLIGKGTPRIGVHMISSSLARTWYYAGVIAPLILNKYPDGVVLFWAGSHWIRYYHKEKQELEEMTLRDSAALVYNLDLLIASDSAFSHIAEATETKSLNIYTTVPAWTRSKYYRFATSLQATTECSPCFAIWSECPMAEKKALENLDNTEKLIVQMNRDRIPLETACRKLNTTPQGLELQFEAVRRKIEGLKQTEAPCLRSINPDEILLQADRLLGGKEADRELCSIIIVDSGKEHIHRLVRSIKGNTSYPYKLIIVKQGNRTYAQNCNIGIRKATGFYFVFMNDDTVVFEGWLTSLIRRFVATGAGAIGPSGAMESVSLKEAHKIAVARRENYFLERRENLSGFCLLTSRKIIEAIGNWDEGYEQMFDDTDFTMRIGKQFPLYYAGDIFVWHKQLGSTRPTEETIQKIDRSQSRWEKTFGTQLPYRMASQLLRS